MQKHGSDYRNFFTMFLLIGNSANPYFFQSVEMLIISFSFLFIIWYFKKDDVILNRIFYVFLFCFTFLHVLEILTFNLFPLKTILGEYLRIAFAIIALQILGHAFIDTFVKFVIFFAFVSIIFYFTGIIFPSIPDFLLATLGKYTQAPFVHNQYSEYDIRTNIILFNFNQIELKRNSGFYWEPGAHGGFLILALLFNLFYKNVPILAKKNLLLLLTIITTLSTTSYVVLFVVLLGYFKREIIQRPFLTSFIVVVVLIASLQAYEKLDFLQKKINTQLSLSNKGIAGESRFASLNLDIELIKEHPLIGSGRNIEMRYGKGYYNLTYQEQHRNNGVGILLSTYGIPYFLFFLCLSFYSFKKVLHSNFNSVLGLLTLLLISFSEDYFFKVFFLSLLLYGCIDTKKEKVLGNSIIYREMQLT